MDKYQAHTRTRTPGRSQRHGPPRTSHDLSAARQVATRFVAEHWPTLATVAPAVSVQRRGTQAPSSELLKRLEMQASEVGQRQGVATYTFTFTSQRGTSDGGVAPLVAAVTVDNEQRVIKASLSK